VANSLSPTPIDPRGPRFNQAVVTVLLLGAFVLEQPLVVPVVAVVLLTGAALGPRWGPFLLLYSRLIRPRLDPPSEMEDPRPPRFAAAVGVVVLSAATIAFVAGLGLVGWVLTLVVAVLAGLAATTGICVGCEIWLFRHRQRPGLRRRRRRPPDRGAGRRLPRGGQRRRSVYRRRWHRYNNELRALRWRALTRHRADKP